MLSNETAITPRASEYQASIDLAKVSGPKQPEVTLEDMKLDILNCIEESVVELRGVFAQSSSALAFLEKTVTRMNDGVDKIYQNAVKSPPSSDEAQKFLDIYENRSAIRDSIASHVGEYFVNRPRES